MGLLIVLAILVFFVVSLPQKQLTPDQQKFQAESAQWFERVKILHV